MIDAATVGAAQEQAARALSDAAVPNARADARLLVAHAAGLSREAVMGYPEHPLAPDAAETLRALVLRRIEREPMAYLLGRREFWSLSFRVTPDTLAPRPDSETVVEAVLGQLRDRTRPWSVLDLGTGTGCLLLATLSELANASGIGIDASPAALAVARDNARELGLGDRSRFLLGNWGRVLARPFDIILCNPPYIPEGEIDSLEPEVANHEPRFALSGGPDGLAAYRALLPDVSRLLSQTGLAAIEVGAGQAEAVAAMLPSHHLRLVKIRRDLAGIDRCLVVAAA